MKKTIVALLLTIAFVSCNSKEKKEEEETMVEPKKEVDVETTSAPNLEVGCYSYNDNGNKVVLEITQINDSIVGTLNYAFKEKDANTGYFSGVLKDSVLIGDYTFMSEGTESSREVAFLVKENQLIEGFGELDEKGTGFKDKKNISFTSSMPLSKSECVE
ncbi:hypothetical protein K1F50_06150 [Muricauda oceani]|uniref:Lipoprotein n=1 Tax=Flagellimonas oceani TaxID=2698672 RepID=A0A6G7J6Q2_9FLAO|nr:hypothetical protein [Allomuricauda oceani]MBW8242376.1 hypothetical protein [Allomuricauda oceani]QII46132.1 hypothetical protein GVT53_16080 [Allomuricauda oceani]